MEQRPTALPRPRPARGRRRAPSKSLGDKETEPFFHSNDEAVPPRFEEDEGDASMPKGSAENTQVEDDFYEDEVFRVTKTVKPQDQFVDMQFGFAGIVSALLRQPLLCRPAETSSANTDPSLGSNPPQNDAKSYGLLGYFIIMLYDCATAFLKRYLVCSHSESSPSHLAEEDGLFVNSSRSSTSSQASKSRNQIRAEERFRRELSLTPKQEKESDGQRRVSGRDEKYDSSVPTAGEEAIAVKIDESFWVGPGQHLVGPEKRGGRSSVEFKLSIHVKEINFSQHPEFTAEEEAFGRINTFYEEYRKHVEGNSFHCLVSRLADIFKRLRSAGRNEESKESSESTMESMMVPLLDDLKSTSSDLVAESAYLKSISLQIQGVWREIVAARESAGFSSADVELKTVELASWELTDDVNRLMIEMKSAKRILNRIRRNDSYQSAMTSSHFQLLDNVESTLSDMNHISQVLELVQADQSQPGWIPKAEKSRRHKVGSEKYFARLLLNGSVVGDTRAEQLDWPSFSVQLNHSFHCQMTQKPADACIQIWKSTIGFVTDNLICTCLVNVLEDETIALDKGNEDSNQVSPLPAAAGVWLQFSSHESDLQRRRKGRAWLASRCIVRTVKRSSPATHMAEMPMQDTNIFHQSKRLIRPPDHKAPNKKTSEAKNLIGLDRQSMMAFKHPANGILFSNKFVFEEPLRHVLIRERQRGALSVPSPIPITELEVQNNDVYNNLARNMDHGSTDEAILNDSFRRGTANKQRVFDVLKESREYSQMGKACRRKKHFSEVIQDVGLFRLRAMMQNDEVELPFPPRKRSLFPENVPRLPVRNQISFGKSHPISLLLTVIGGTNVPTKLEAESPINTKSRAIGDDDNLRLGEGEEIVSIADDDEVSDLGSLVKIKIRGNTYQTKIIGGTMSPQWKQTIRVPLYDIIKDDSLLREESIDITIFDCTKVDMRHMGGYYDDEETVTTEFHYLGHASMPLVTILREGTIDGLIQCQSPDIVVGYSKEAIPHGEGESGNHLLIMETECRRETSSNSMVLRLHATTEPYTLVPSQLFPESRSNEAESLLQRTQQWFARTEESSKFNAMDPEDYRSVLWPDSHRNSYIASRFITEQAPPSGFQGLSSCAHYVSLIPSLDSESQRDNVILKSQEFIDVMAGNRIEHAILLTNFFIHLSKTGPSEFGADLFLAIGFAIPEGKTAYVVRRCQKNGEVTFWDATTGQAYPQNDDSCPLQKIFFLVSIDKLLGNVDREKKPSLLDFDVSNAKKWFPLYLDGIMTVQDETLKFTPADTHYGRQLQIEVNESVQHAIRGWRRVATSFRSDVSAKIACIIEKLEQSRLDGKPVSGSEAALGGSTKARKVFGFTLHFSFSTLQHVLDRVKATEIHSNKHPQVEYAIAVRAFSYPGGVISLWVFVCSLVPKALDGP